MMTMTSSRLLLATNNPGKVAEIKALLGGLGLQLLTPHDLNLQIDVAEDGRTYAENATKKARAFSEASGLVSLGDDSGLEVDALSGRPGIYSHRFAPQPLASDADRRRYLLDQLRDKPRPWSAHFMATVAVAIPGGVVHLAEGGCEGEIIPEERGSYGFGYDPIFYFPGLGLTMAELEMDEKNRLSHRARAVQKAIPMLMKVVRN